MGVWRFVGLPLAILVWLTMVCEPFAIAFEWIPYVPPENTVELHHWVLNGVSYVDVSITFPHVNFNVSDWGEPIIIGNSISVDAEIWEYTGPTTPVIITVQHTYELGTLFPGEYIFTFMAWGQTVKSITFKLVRDVAITNVWTFKNVVGVGITFDPPRKTIGHITVNVTNEGDYPEVFNLTVFIGPEPVPIQIERWPDPDGSWSDKFWSKGDVNRDGYIDYYDLSLLKAYWGWEGPPGHPVDLNSDGKVDAKDALRISNNFDKNIWNYFGLERTIQDYAVVSLNSTYYEFIGFRWNTTEISKGNYTISAYAWPVPDESDIEDNTFINGFILVAFGGDITGTKPCIPDGAVDMRDIAWVSKAFGASYTKGPGGIVGYWHPTSCSMCPHDPKCDMNDDLVIDMKDIAIISKQFGKHDP